MSEPRTHLRIDPSLVGEPVELGEGRATARLVTTVPMAADARGLVHGGFVFGLVDYAAMLAVNHPHVVLGTADVRFTAPVKVGDEVLAHAEREDEKGWKHVLRVRACVGEVEVLRGTVTAFVLDAHVFDSGD